MKNGEDTGEDAAYCVRRSRHLRGLTILGLLLISLVSGGAVSFAADPCERYVSATRRSQGKSGYRHLGDRCEGLLYQPTSPSGGLFLVSLLAGTARPSDENLIEVRFARPGSGPVHVQATPLAGEVLYRMDAETTGDSFSWPAKIPRDSALTVDDLGVVASLDVSGQQVFLPVALKGNSETAWPKTAIFVSNAQIRPPTVTLAAESDGGWTQFLVLDGGVTMIDPTTATLTLAREHLWPNTDGGNTGSKLFKIMLTAGSPFGGRPSSTSFVVFAERP